MIQYMLTKFVVHGEIHSFSSFLGKYIVDT